MFPRVCLVSTRYRFHTRGSHHRCRTCVLDMGSPLDLPTRLGQTLNVYYAPRHGGFVARSAVRMVLWCFGPDAVLGRFVVRPDHLRR